MEMLHAIRDAVLEHKADVGLGFDGDGDRCGVVDNTGDEIFADKVGVMLARDMSAIHKNAQFVVDVKSTGLFVTDPVLQKQGAHTTYWKTGHSYMKRRTHELKALAGFEKSGHFFFNAPVGRGYGRRSCFSDRGLRDARPRAGQDDGGSERRRCRNLVVADQVAALLRDETKYGIVAEVVKHFEDLQAKGAKVAGQPIRDLVTVNGVRVTCEDGSWGLVRASSNKPELVVVVESPGVREAYARHVRSDGFGVADPSGSRRVQQEDLSRFSFRLLPSHRWPAVCRFRAARIEARKPSTSALQLLGMSREVRPAAWSNCVTACPAS